MEKNIVSRIDNWIRYSFYALFFTVPLIMNNSTFELFEFPKMWITYAIAIVIFALWLSKMAITKSFFIRRTPLDIVLLLFLASQIISTLFSIDRYVSFWGYYSRFNGGLLSTITYIFLYYAYASNMLTNESDGENKLSHAQRITAYIAGVTLVLLGGLTSGIFTNDFFKLVDVFIWALPGFILILIALPKLTSLRMLTVTLTSGLVVSLWGLPSHFGADPTCFVFRGELNTACWTSSFVPTLRIFSTLGQPNWLAAYLSALIPISAAFAIMYTRSQLHSEKKNIFQKLARYITPISIFYLIVTLLFYLGLQYTKSQSGFIGFWIGNIIFVGLVLATIWKEKERDVKSVIKHKAFSLFVLTNILLLVVTVLQGAPLQELRYLAISKTLQNTPPAETTQNTANPETPQGPALEVAGSGSGRIRLIVWQGALDIFKMYPIFGSGPETFAFAYYKVRPIEHNLTSEWDFLYNKAHNEYLNYLSTTGIVGLGTYVAFITFFFFTALKILWKGQYKKKYRVLACSLLGALITILVSNFFGFSVVMLNLMLFIIPLWFYDVTSHSVFTHPKEEDHSQATVTAGNATVMTVIGLVAISLIWILYLYWKADQHYALGNNLNKVGEYVSANPELIQAVSMRPREDLFKDELSINLATLALALNENQQATQAAQLAQQAKALSDTVTANHPHNVVYAKSRTRVMYSLAQIDPSYNDETLQAIERAHELAPTDAKIMYNLALLYDQTGDRPKAMEALRKTIELKPNYMDARYALAVYGAEELKKSQEKGDSVTAAKFREETKSQINYILLVDPKHEHAQELLKSLK